MSEMHTHGVAERVRRALGKANEVRKTLFMSVSWGSLSFAKKKRRKVPAVDRGLIRDGAAGERDGGG
jgi:hypothetical protein